MVSKAAGEGGGLWRGCRRRLGLFRNGQGSGSGSQLTAVHEPAPSSGAGPSRQKSPQPSLQQEGGRAAHGTRAARQGGREGPGGRRRGGSSGQGPAGRTAAPPAAPPPRTTPPPPHPPWRRRTGAPGCCAPQPAGGAGEPPPTAAGSSPRLEFALAVLLGHTVTVQVGPAAPAQPRGPGRPPRGPGLPPPLSPERRRRRPPVGENPRPASQTKEPRGQRARGPARGGAIRLGGGKAGPHASAGAP